MKLHKNPCPNLNAINETIEDVVDIFGPKLRISKPIDFNLAILILSQPKMDWRAALIFSMSCIHSLTLESLDLLSAE